MKPLIDGYYLSEQFRTEEMHAGVRMQDAYFRFLKLFPDGFWLWSDKNRDDFDFPQFVRQFDLNHWRTNHKTESPPTAPDRDGGHLFEFGTYATDGNVTIVSFYSSIAEMEFSYNISLSDDGTRLTGWKRDFRFHNDDS